MRGAPLNLLRAALLASLGFGHSACEPESGAEDQDAGAGGASSPFPCVNPEPVVIGGVATGFDRCAGGFVRRREIGACPNVAPRTTTCHMDGFAAQCATDAECNERPNGFCNAVYDAGCYCNYGCTSDSECPEGTICWCGDPVGMCTTAVCKSDADCADRLCTTFTLVPGCPYTAFSCQAETDECGGDGDCAEGQQCTFDGHRFCLGGTCSLGRPFAVDGHERSSPIAARGDWLRASLSALAEVPDELRAELAAHWTLAARLEHASIASFARFILQLTALGAPSGLVDDATRALGDEIRHAQACFAIASAYSRSPLGPGPLDVGGALDAAELSAVARALVVEGCVGETVAALEAAEGALHAADPALRSVLDEIATDETCHASLAWRCLRWMCGTDPGLIELAQAAIVAAIADAEADAVSCASYGAGRLARYGVLSHDERRRLRLRALREVALPCIDALGSSFGSPRTAPSALAGASGVA